MDIDLETYSLEDLRALRGQIDKAIGSFETRKRRDALAAAEEAARQHGFNLNDLTSRSRGGGRGRRNAANPAAGAEPAPGAKYANPDEPAQTWSGRGRRPRWVTEQLEAGRSLEDMRA